MPGKKAPQACPDCGSDMWDNSQTKKGKQPDYVCKDTECRKGVWLSNTQRNAEQGAAGPPRAGAPPAQPKRIVVLESLWATCYTAAGEQMSASIPAFVNGSTAGVVDVPTLSDRIAVANALFEARTQGVHGILKLEKKIMADREAAEKAKREEAARRQREEEERQRQAAGPSDYDPDPRDAYNPDYDDGLPF